MNIKTGGDYQEIDLRVYEKLSRLHFTIPRLQMGNICHFRRVYRGSDWAVTLDWTFSYQSKILFHFRIKCPHMKFKLNRLLSYTMGTFWSCAFPWIDHESVVVLLCAINIVLTKLKGIARHAPTPKSQACCTHSRTLTRYPWSGSNATTRRNAEPCDNEDPVSVISCSIEEQRAEERRGQMSKGKCASLWGFPTYLSTDSSARIGEGLNLFPFTLLSYLWKITEFTAWSVEPYNDFTKLLCG